MIWLVMRMFLVVSGLHGKYHFWMWWDIVRLIFNWCFDLGLVHCVLAGHWYADRCYQAVNHGFGWSVGWRADFRLVDRC